MAAKTFTKHPYAAMEHRVIESPAYANLSFSARSLFVLITRQPNKDNNGHLQATFSYMRRFGFDSEHTISRCIKELIAHGMIYRARSGGYQQGAAQYPVTWLPIKNRQGIFLDGFKACAWRDWQPDQKKPPLAGAGARSERVFAPVQWVCWLKNNQIKSNVVMPTREVGISLVRWLGIEQTRLQTGYILEILLEMKSA